MQESKWAEGETKAKEYAEETKESNGKVDKISRKHLRNKPDREVISPAVPWNFYLDKIPNNVMNSRN